MAALELMDSPPLGGKLEIWDFRVQLSGSRVQGFGFMAWGWGFGVLDLVLKGVGSRPREVGFRKVLTVVLYRPLPRLSGRVPHIAWCCVLSVSRPFG